MPGTRTAFGLDCIVMLSRIAALGGASGRRRFVARLERRAREEGREEAGVTRRQGECDGRLSQLQKGWYWGSRDFSERMLEKAKENLRKPAHRSLSRSPERLAHGEKEAKRLLAEGLAASGLESARLAGLPGSDARKVAIADVIRAKTTMGMGWISEALAMRSAANASQQLRRWRSREKNLLKRLKRWVAQSRNVA